MKHDGHLHIKERISIDGNTQFWRCRFVGEFTENTCMQSDRFGIELSGIELTGVDLSGLEVLQDTHGGQLGHIGRAIRENR